MFFIIAVGEERLKDHFFGKSKQSMVFGPDGLKFSI